MTLTQRSLERISTSVAYTESVQRGTKTGRRKGWPRINQNQWIVKGVVVDAPISWGGSGQIDVWINGVPQGTPYKTVWHDWLGSGEEISVGVNVIAEYFQNEDVWTITNADCEPEEAPAPPGHGDAITALGTDQTGAQGLSFRVNRVDTVNAGVDDGVRLPATFEQADDCFVQNNTASTLNIYPSTGDSIDNNAVNIPVTLAGSGSAHFFLVQSDKWVT
jgi:hypothetical protein